MTTQAAMAKPSDFFATRRGLVLGALGSVGLGAGAAVVEHFWMKKDMTARLLNPYSLAQFDLPPVEGLLDGAGNPVPGLASADLSKGRALLVLFASWCPTCRAEHEHVVALAKRNLAPIYGVDVKDPPARARLFLGKYGNPFAAVGADEKAFMQFALGARGVPATFLVGPGPVIEWATYDGLDEETIEREIVPRLTGAP